MTRPGRPGLDRGPVGGPLLVHPMGKKAAILLALLAQLVVAMSPLELVLCMHGDGAVELELGGSSCCDEVAEVPTCAGLAPGEGAPCEDMELAVRLPQGRTDDEVLGEEPRGGELPMIEGDVGRTGSRAGPRGTVAVRSGATEAIFPLGQRELRLRV